MNSNLRELNTQSNAVSAYLNIADNKFPKDYGRLVDVDLRGQDWIGCFENKDVFSVIVNDEVVQRHDKALYHHQAGAIVRFVGCESFVFAGAHHESSEITATLFSLKTRSSISFSLGYYVSEIVSCGFGLMVSYTDQGIYAQGNIGESIFALFDLNGNILFNYKTAFGDKAAVVSDCYAACLGKGDSYILLSYPDFNLIRINFKKGAEVQSQKVYKLPKIVAGARACSEDNDRAYFCKNNEIFGVDLNDLRYSKLGKIKNGKIRGMPGGRFLSFRGNSFSLIRCGSPNK